MRIKTQVLLLFLLLLSSQLLHGQSNSPVPYTQDDLRHLGITNPGASSIRSFDHRNEGLKGTPLLSEEWQKANFLLGSQSEFGQEVSVKLDLWEQLLYFQLVNGAVSLLPSAKLQALRIYSGKDQYRLFRVYPESEIEGSKNQKHKFYEVLFDGPFVLLKHHFKEIRRAENQGALSTSMRLEEYIDQSSLWLQEAGNPFSKVKLNAKSVEKALPEQGGSIQKVIETQRIDLSREEELIRLLKALQNLN